MGVDPLNTELAVGGLDPADLACGFSPSRTSRIWLARVRTEGLISHTSSLGVASGQQLCPRDPEDPTGWPSSVLPKRLRRQEWTILCALSTVRTFSSWKPDPEAVLGSALEWGSEVRGQVPSSEPEERLFPLHPIPHPPTPSSLYHEEG